MENKANPEGSGEHSTSEPLSETGSSDALTPSGLAVDVLLAAFPDIEPDLVKSIYHQSDSPEVALLELRALRNPVDTTQWSEHLEDAGVAVVPSGPVSMVQTIVDPSATTALEDLFGRFPDIDPGVVSVVLSEVDGDSTAAARLLEGMRGDVSIPVEEVTRGQDRGSSTIQVGAVSTRKRDSECLSKQFPGIEPGLITLLLDDCEGNVDRTIEMLNSLAVTQHVPDETTQTTTVGASSGAGEGGPMPDAMERSDPPIGDAAEAAGGDSSDDDDFALVDKRKGRAEKRPISEPPAIGTIISMPSPEDSALERLVDRYSDISSEVVAMLWSESGENYDETVSQLDLLSGKTDGPSTENVVTGMVGAGATVAEVPAAVEGSDCVDGVPSTVMLSPETLRSRYPDMEEEVFSMIISNCRGDMDMANEQLGQVCGVDPKPSSKSTATGGSSFQPPAVWIDSNTAGHVASEQPGTPLGAAIFEDFFSKPVGQGESGAEEGNGKAKETEEDARRGEEALENLDFFVEMFPEFEADDLAHVLLRSVDADEALEVLLAFTTDDLIDPLPPQMDQAALDFDISVSPSGPLEMTKNVVRTSLERYMNPAEKPSYKAVAAKNAPEPTTTPPVCPPSHVDKGKQKMSNSAGSKYYEREKIYDNYRDRVSDLAEKRNACFRRASEAWNSGNRTTHHDHLQKGRMYARLMEEAQKEASDAIFEEINKHNPSKLFIDLHGLHVNEAIRKLRERIQDFRAGGVGGDLRIVTGRGRNSYTGPKLLPAVKGYLDQCQIPYSIKIGSVVAHLKAEQ